MRHMKNTTVTLATLEQYLVSCHYEHYILESELLFRIHFEKMKIFQQPNLIYLKNNSGDYFCIRDIGRVELLDNVIRVYISDKGYENVFHIYPCNAK